MLILHILIALTSIITATAALVHPTKGRLAASYALVAATLATGTWLVVTLHARLLQSCFEGLCYLAFVGVMLVAAHYRAASSERVAD